MKTHNSRFCILFSIITGSHATSVSWFLMRPVFVYCVEHWYALSKCAASSPMYVRLCRYLINYCNYVYFFELQFTSINSQIRLCLETGWWHKSITPESLLLQGSLSKTFEYFLPYISSQDSSRLDAEDLHTSKEGTSFFFLPCLEPIQHPIQWVSSNPVPGVMMLECKDKLETWLRMGKALPTFVYDVFAFYLQATEPKFYESTPSEKNISA